MKVLAPHLTLSIPRPLALGNPSAHYPWNWSIYEWFEGKSANTVLVNDLELKEIAWGLAQFLNELQKIDTTNGPLAGPQNFYRGGDLSVYDDETRSAIFELRDFINVGAVTSLWEKALNTKWEHPPVWVHGDLSAGNILIKEQKLAAIIDFGCMGVGDPACDLGIAWTYLTKESRKTFKSHILLDQDTWTRARGWVLWKSLITFASFNDKASSEALKQKSIIDEILNEDENKGY